MRRPQSDLYWENKGVTQVVQSMNAHTEEKSQYNLMTIYNYLAKWLNLGMHNILLIISVYVSFFYIIGIVNKTRTIY